MADVTPTLADLLTEQARLANDALRQIAELKVHLEAKRAEILIEALEEFEPETFNS